MTEVPTGAPFGVVDDRPAWLFTLRNARIVARITDYGGRLVSLQVADRAGRRDHVVLGFDDSARYAAAGGSFGALLGRNANRIAGGKLVIDGRIYALAMNEPSATLHGGPVGFGKCFWEVVAAAPEALRLRLTSPDGDQGFPGEVNVTATYALRDNALHLVFDATTSQPTPVTLSAHPYFNLDGMGMPDCLGHRVQILAPHFLPTDAGQIPTGELHAVTGTPFDFSQPRTIGARIREDDPQLRYGKGYDHYFILPAGGTGQPAG